MKKLTKDQEFLIIFASVIFTLIFVNFPLFIKSLANNNKFAFPKIKNLASELEIPQFRQKEQAFWNNFKEINFSEEESTETLPESTETLLIDHNETDKTYQRFLLIGDSSMYELSTVLNYDLRIVHNIKNVRLDYRASTGLNNINNYNWYEKTPEFIQSYKADVLIVMFGADEAQEILKHPEESNIILTAQWKQEYRKKVDQYLQIISNSPVKKVYWIGQPISNLDHYNTVYPELNKIYKEVSQKYPKIEFIDTWQTFAINNQFSHSMTDKSGKKGYVRVSDGLHFTDHGARVLGESILDYMIKDQVFNSKSSQIELAGNSSLNQQVKTTENLENLDNNKEKLEKENYEKFLLIGDSTMYDLSVILNHDLRKNYNVKNIRLDYRVSSGLNRLDYYNWQEKTPQFIESYQADVLIVIFGGNDDQDILDSQGKYHSQLSEGWQQTYRERVEKYAEAVSNSSVKKIYWIGQPISNVGRFNKFFPVLNKIYREVSENHPKIEFVDTWNAFSQNGKFSPIMTDKSGKKAYVRISDGVHFTSHGARILGELIMEEMAEDQVIPINQ
jgi:uncharacterized protein